MIKILRYTSLVTLLAATVTLVWTFMPATGVRRGAAALDFPRFDVGTMRRIDFSQTAGVDAAGAYDNEQDRARRRLDQLRDWCLLTIVSASTLEAKAIAEVTFDLPVRREESLRRLAVFDYGVSRSRVLGEDDVVALVPADGDRQREELSRIADEQRKNLGRIPARFHVFQYELHEDDGYAELMRRASVAGADLFTPAYGYSERSIATRSDLATLLGEIDDLTMARRSGSAVLLGGRRLASPIRPGIGLEEVATIWRGQQGLPDYQGVGFSLDPRVDVVAAAAVLAGLEQPLERLFGVDRQYLDKARAVLAQPEAKTPRERATQADGFMKALVAACDASADRRACLTLVGDETFMNSYQVARYEGHNLAGTEVGMVLFYTDLLMKLWSFDFEGAAPRAIPGFPIKSEMTLSPVYRGDVERAPNTRLWLEPLDRGYQITDGRDSILFARVATRVSARPHNFVTGRDESFEPNIFTRVFIDWWNDHYEEVALHEPQYQRLNQITKWGVVIAWLDLERALPALAFLSDAAPQPVQVNRRHRLPVWKDQHRDLTFTAWDKVHFDSPQDAKAEFESLAMLRSRDIPYFTGPIWFEGGVSLSSRATIAEHAAINRGLSRLEATARRAGIDARVSNLSAGRLRTLDATSYEFRNYSQQAVSTLARAKQSTRLRDAFGEMENMAIDRTVRRTADGVVLRTQAQASGSSHLAGELGELAVTRSGRNFALRWDSRDLDLGHSLARRLSVARDADVVLAENRNLEVAISLGDRGHLVRARGSNGWIQLSPAPADSTTIAPGFQARVAGIGNNARTMDVAWVDDAAVRAQLESGGFVEVRSAEAASGGGRLRCCSRAPPSGASETTFEAAGQNVRAFADRAGTRYVRVADLPPSLQSDLGTLIGSPARLDPLDARLVQSMRGGEYRQAAKDLVVDRLEFQQRLNRIVEYEIRFAQSIADQRAALSYVDDAIRQFGPTPELSAQKALIHLRTGDADAATAALNAAKSRAGGVERVIDETLGATRPQAMIEAQHHTRVADWLQWQRTADRSGTVVADVRGGRVTFTLRVDKAWQGRSIPPSEVGALLEDRTVVVYLHDHPSLNNIDVFSTPGRRSLQQLVQSQRLTLRELELDDVARLRPERLARTIDRPTGFNLVPPAAPDAPFGGGPSTGGDDDEERRRQRKARVVIIEIQQ